MGRRRNLEVIDTIVIHCAATPNNDRRFTVEQIDKWHAQRGFKRSGVLRKWHNPNLKAIGYHYVIDIDGKIHSGRGLDETGAHTSGHNTSSIGICMMGTDRFTAEQWLSLRRLVQILEATLGRPIIIMGHRDFKGVHKSCPGFSVSEWLTNNMLPQEEGII